MKILYVGFSLFMGCASKLPTPEGALSAVGLQRLYCVQDDSDGRCIVYRSAQPTEAQFEYLKHYYGIQSVIKLNTWLPGDGGKDILPGSFGAMELYHHQWLPAGPVSHDDVLSTLRDLDRADRPVLIHCLHGEDRTGLLIGLWRVEHLGDRNGAIPFAAWGEMRAYGFHSSLIGLTETFEKETGYEP